MSKKVKILLFIVAVLALGVILVFVLKSCQDSEPSSGLLGTWTFTGDFLEPDVEADLVLQINEFAPAPDAENTYLGVGCMQTETSGGWAPLSLQAVFDPLAKTYALNILSTLVAPELEGGAAVIRFVGDSTTGSASGVAYLFGDEIAWSGKHTSQKVVECPAWDAALRFQGEVGNERDLAYIPPRDITGFGSENLIVSSQMQVETPDGQVILVPWETDIFTPDVNFIDSFRYHGGFEGTPILSQSYRFTLLDLLGEPIPGLEAFDRYLHCDHGAAVNLRAVYDPEAALELTWDAPALVPRRFEPLNGHGFYQLTLEHHPWQEAGFLYGTESLLTTHNIPWDSFIPGSQGSPDGADYGVSLSELEDGTYIIQLATYNYHEPEAGESGFDCRVTDSRQALIFTKQGSQITFQPAGAVSGFLHDADGNPLGGIAVQVNGAETGFVETVCSMDNGYFLFTRLPLDTFSLSTGGFGTEDCQPNDYETLILPDFTLTEDAPILDDLDLVLTQQE
ncbi:MAG: carboxypeptidase regulatory-like domain-containing protein [Chloroflexi bacterium]|nr:carboxypeptidase regulatory-like domain-containing protein [Chloroflexota bacterium]